MLCHMWLSAWFDLQLSAKTNGQRELKGPFGFFNGSNSLWGIFIEATCKTHSGENKWYRYIEL